MLSLAAGMSVFLCIATLLASQAEREYNYNFRDFYMVVKNDTMRKEEQEKRLQIFDQTVLDKLNDIEGVTETAPLYYTEITVPWEPEFADVWMREFYVRRVLISFPTCISVPAAVYKRIEKRGGYY